MLSAPCPPLARPEVGPSLVPSLAAPFMAKWRRLLCMVGWGGSLTPAHTGGHQRELRDEQHDRRRPRGPERDPRDRRPRRPRVVDDVCVRVYCRPGAHLCSRSPPLTLTISVDRAPPPPCMHATEQPVRCPLFLIPSLLPRSSPRPASSLVSSSTSSRP
jgi:hypothetical protein